MRTAYTFVLLPALAGVALGALAFFAPIQNTGVDGTPGALLALFGAASVALGSLVALLGVPRGRGIRLLDVLLAIGALLTATAAYFLMQYLFAAVMALAIVGLFAALVFQMTSRTA